MKDVQSLVKALLQPSQALVADTKKLEGDIFIWCGAGKMGPALARLAREATDLAGVNRRIIGVSRFSESQTRAELEADGIETITADLLNEDHLGSLPDATNVLYMAGTKFGTTGTEPFTSAMNAYLPGRVAGRYRNPRNVA